MASVLQFGNPAGEMEINNGEYFRILKKMLNLIETALHRGAFIHISTFFPILLWKSVPILLI